MAHLIPGDASMVATRALVFAIWSVTPLCWLYTLSFVLHRLGFWPSDYIPQGVLGLQADRGITSIALLLYCLAENAFSIYLYYLGRKIQKRGPRPLYGRRFLRYVFSRALGGGLGASTFAEGQAVPVYRPDRGVSAGYNLRKRLAPVTPAGGAVANGNGNGVASAPTPTSALTEEEKAKAARVGRLRSVSFVPAFVDDELEREDPRAAEFAADYRRWFWGVDAEDLTRRDVEHWLAWALYGATLEEIEEESKPQLHAHDASAHGAHGVPPRNFSSPAPPEWSEPSTRALRPTLRSMASTTSTYSEEDVRGVKAEPGEWEDPVRGTRLDFLHYCRELIEARQGYTLPEQPRAGAPPHRAEGGPRIRTMRLTVDPVRLCSRPLAVYALTNTLSWLAIRRAVRGGFKRERRGRLEYLIYRPKGWTPAQAIREKSPRLRPLIFLHGLGIGLAQYIEVVEMFLRDEDAMRRPILIPIQPSISQNIFHRYFLRPLGHHETTGTLRKVFRAEGWDAHGCHIDLLGHSWGTITASFLLKSFPGLIDRVCLVDPVCFQLWVPHVCANFLYLRADTPMKVLLRYFVARELGTANVLCRTFDWSSSTLWPESEIPGLTDPLRTRILLAENDSILSAQANYRYLRENGMRDDSEGGGLFMGKGMVHGELLMHTGIGMRKIKAWMKGEYL